MVLLALILIAGVSVLLRWLETRDTGHQVAGVPTKFDMAPSREQARQPERPQPEQQPPEQRQPMPETQRPVADLKLLLETPDKKGLVGLQVVLEDAPVQAVVGNYTFWVGPDARSRVPVVLIGELMQRQPEARVRVREGERVRVFGVVRELRDVDVIEPTGFLSAKEREELERVGIFISAQRVVQLGP